MKKVKISVAMAVYNGEKYIAKQLHSIVSQSLKPDEIIVVDDASHDSTFNLVQEYLGCCFEGNSIIKRHEVNLGYRHTFFEAISYTTSDIVFLADQDDIWCLNKLEYMTGCFLDNPEIMALNTSHFLIDEKDNLISKNNLFLGRIRKIDLHDVLKYNVSMGCTMAFRSGLRDELMKYRLELVQSALPHDWLINIVAATKNGLYKSDIKTIYYRLHADNTLGLRRAVSIPKRISAYRNMMNQKQAMKRILELYYEDEQILKYIDRMVDNYSLRIKALEKRSVGNYLKILFFGNLLCYCKFTTIGYDMKLILLDKRSLNNEDSN